MSDGWGWEPQFVRVSPDGLISRNRIKSRLDPIERQLLLHEHSSFATGVPSGSPYVSTGRLPTHEEVTTLGSEAHTRYKSNAEGESSQGHPALTRVRRVVSVWMVPVATFMGSAIELQQHLGPCQSN